MVDPFAVTRSGGHHMGVDLARTWAGFATQSKIFAGHLGVAEWKGTMARLDDPARYMCTFDANVMHLSGGGFAIGQSGHLMFFFNVSRAPSIEGQSFGNGMDSTLAIPGSKLVGLALKAEKVGKFFKAVWDAQAMLELANSAYAGVTTRSPTVVAIPLPGLDGVVGVSRSEGFGGRINIRYVITPQGITADA